MCDPATIIAASSLAVGTASSVANFNSQKQAANAQAEMNRQTAANAVIAANDTYAATQTRMGQDVAVASNDKFNASIAANEARATALTAAGEGGVQGYSITNLLNSYNAKQGRYDAAIDTNLQMSRQGLADSMAATQRGTVSTINGMPRPQAPSYLDAAIRVAGSGLSAATDYYKMTK